MAGAVGVCVALALEGELECEGGRECTRPTGDLFEATADDGERDCGERVVGVAAACGERCDVAAEAVERLLVLGVVTLEALVEATAAGACEERSAAVSFAPNVGFLPRCFKCFVI